MVKSQIADSTIMIASSQVIQNLFASHDCFDR